jgi:hypothetical protein
MMTSNDVLERIMNHEMNIQEANNIKNLYKDVSSSKKQDTTVKATNKNNKKKKAIIESSSEEDEDEDEKEYYHGFTTGFERGGAHRSDEQWDARGTRV